MSFIQIAITHSKGHMPACPWLPGLLYSLHLIHAGHCWPTLVSKTSGHSWANLAQSLVGSLLLSPGSWCTQGFLPEADGKSDRLYFGLQITADGDCSHKIKFLALWKKSYDKPRQHIEKQRHYFASKGPSSQSYGFSSSHVWMWELDYKESWLPKKWKLMLSNCGTEEDSWESLGLPGDETSPS